MGSFFGSLFGHLLDHFWRPFWGPFWDQIGPRRGQDEPKRAIKSFKDPKSNLFKNIKNPSVFLMFLGSRGLPREPQEAQEGSQEAPKELQNLPKKGSKNRPQKSQVLDQFWLHFGAHFGTQKWTKNGTKNGTIFGSSGAWSRWPQVGRFWPQVAHPDRHPFAHVR